MFSNSDNISRLQMLFYHKMVLADLQDPNHLQIHLPKEVILQTVPHQQIIEWECRCPLEIQAVLP